jgi:hypothetical protein
MMSFKAENVAVRKWLANAVFHKAVCITLNTHVRKGIGCVSVANTQMTKTTEYLQVGLKKF